MRLILEIALPVNKLTSAASVKQVAFHLRKYTLIMLAALTGFSALSYHEFFAYRLIYFKPRDCQAIFYIKKPLC